ncbi:ABC transporter permease [Rhodoplanes roseus]|nr:ABC transporter permease [Rhodoplanes roseus]
MSRHDPLWLRVRSVASVVVVLAAWEAVARAGLVPPLFLPAFSTVVVTLWGVIRDGSLPEDLAISLGRAAGGLTLATLAGVLVGIAMARNRVAHWLLDPFVALGFPSPKIAFLPIFILWFGIGSLSKILLVGFACVFPVAIGTYAAARGINRVLIWSGRSLGASAGVLLGRVVLPACAPRIFAAMRVALPVALITTFTAEMVGGGGGMGATLMYSQRFFESPVVFAYLLVMLAVGLVLDTTMRRLQARSPVLRGDA